MPRLSPDFSQLPSSEKEIFEARQIFISNFKITHEFSNYIRPINETEEKKYKNRFSENMSIIDENLFKKRPNQYKYTEFFELAYKEKLIKRFNYLLETDPRIRIFHHIYNLGVFRSRLDGILYFRGKYIIVFDPGDFYEDNYVLLDAYNIIEKYKLYSCKFLFRIIKNFNNLTISSIIYHVGGKTKIEYGSKNTKKFNDKIFKTLGNVWNRLVRSNIYIKGLLSLNELMINVYKNMWDDIFIMK